MSADNGIYILVTPISGLQNGANTQQFRVAHAQAIDNLDYEVPDGWDLDPTQVVAYFHDAQIRWTASEALLLAASMMTDLPICEYGIQIIEAKRPWEKYEQHATMISRQV